MDAVWQDNGPERLTNEEALVVDVDGFEGPMDLLLHLARNQKVDLTQISVLELVRQYLNFIERAKKIRIELAADYLVMAAWLAFLKSKLLIPKPASDDEPTGEEMAAILQYRLQRLEAMRDAASKLVNRNRLGRDVFARGMPETVVLEKRTEFSASLYDLLAAYAGGRQRHAMNDDYAIERRPVWSLKDARTILQRLIGNMSDWTALDSFFIAYIPTAKERRTAIASGFAASLELAREGVLDIRQDKHFAPIYLRDTTAAKDSTAEAAI
ncbi:chromosome segregation protein ScpA [Ahrensia marina]|uniref:Segregation and condensation protein A n=2 Tax=Ahrensia marina TaxID=1514904 RepID=A0A0N0E7T9_9HYPH|nr:ScpA family protein [Ahrensia marina]KPB01585.1 chromosome segregation protein ScpA [Ahrensia marina]